MYHRYITLLLCTAVLSSISLFADNDAVSCGKKACGEKKQAEAFTGQVLRNRVRMRLQPSLDAYVFSELKQGDVLLVTHQVDDFYACLPPRGLKGYIFRTYVLDGAVEGANVNVRLEPDTTSPVVTQLNTGDRVCGVVAPQNSKWLEIDLPDSVKFYVAKEFIGKAGPVSLYAEHGARLERVKQELCSIEIQLDQEMQKPFSQIQLTPFANRLSKVIAENSDMPEEVDQAKAITSKMQEAYLAKSLVASQECPPAPEQPEPTPEPPSLPEQKELAAVLPSLWTNQEERLIQQAIQEGTVETPEQFYANERQKAVSLTGIIKPYNSHVKNRPGDYLLIDSKSQLPIAYLYSTTVDLQEFVAKPVSLEVSTRPNNHFAFAAYFVHSVEG
ncbi:MAG: SH3 domain-containing protein [Verrucomicrobia bacterium]|nr:SH3 domain-containing protein [Verrucomicrobiota bacterium]